MSVDKYIFCLEERKKRCGTFSGKRAGVRLLEKQAASKGELFVQFIYAIAAAVGFAYVSVLIFTLATGNREPLTEHPGLTAFLCLLSGISLANLCRHQSPRFWKIADLIWILCFIPSLAISVFTFAQGSAQHSVERFREMTYFENEMNLEFYGQFLRLHCEQRPLNQVCILVADEEKRLSKISSTRAEYITNLYYLAERSQDWLYRDSSPHGSIGWYLNLTKFLRIDNGKLDSHLAHLIENQTSYSDYWYGTIREFAIQLNRGSEFPKQSVSEPLDDPFLSEVFQFLSTVMRDATDKPDKRWNSMRPLGALRDNVQFDTAFVLKRLIYNLAMNTLVLEDIVELKRSRLKGALMLPILLSSFVFPFRVGKSIFEIAAKKESKNAPVSS